MTTALQLIMALGIWGAVGSFIGAFAANIVLAFYLDGEEVKNRTGRNFLWQIGELRVPVSYYKEKARPLCRIRDWCVKTFFVCLVFVVILFIVSEITGLGPKRS